MKKTINILSGIFILFISILFIYATRTYALKIQLPNNYIDKSIEMDSGVIARVTTINNITCDNYVFFNAKIIIGKYKGKIVQATQSINGIDLYSPPQVSKGNWVILYPIDSNGHIQWLLEDYCRFNIIILMFILFILAIILICGKKGITTLISLGITFIYIVMVLIPFFTSGKNGYISTIIVCFAIVFSSLFIVHGINRKSFSAVIGCWAGLLISCILTVFFQKIMKLTGYIGDDSSHLYELYNYNLDMKAIVFAITVLSCLGATMDVAMSISSSLEEVRKNSSDLNHKILFKSGMEIGKDTIGTMSNTLILAYMGGALVRIIIYVSMNYPLYMLLNKQELIIEFMQSLIGIFAILVTIPITSCCCACYVKLKLNQKSLR